MRKILCLFVTTMMILSLLSCQKQDNNESMLDTITCAECNSSIIKSSNYCSNCGTKVSSIDEATTEAPNLEMTVDELVGTWSPSLWFFETEFVFNDDKTYDYGEGRKGTYSLSEDGSFLDIKSRQGSLPTEDYRLDNREVHCEFYNDLIYIPSVKLSRDTEYGLGFSVDENGKTNQRFSIEVTGIGLDNGTKQFDLDSGCNEIDFEFNMDGTFKIKAAQHLVYNYPSTNHVTANIGEYEGAYSYKDSILTLTYKGNYYPLVVIDGTIYFITFTKK